MKPSQASYKFRDYMRLKHLALSTEQSYLAWLARLVRYRLHEANVQAAIRQASGGNIKPHELRHSYATHCLNSGQNPRAIQQAMGHVSLETTMGYLHAEAMSVRSPLEVSI